MKPIHKIAIGLLCAFTCLASFSAVYAQDAPPAEEKPKKIPAPKDLVLESKDGVSLGATYYKGTLGKDAVPFILVHGWDQRRTDLHQLAVTLQSVGHAVITVDLRGHGDSLTRKPARPGAEPDEIDRKRMKTTDIRAMVYDMQAAKSHLLAENNLGHCNIELLCVVGVSEGALVALEWAVLDWSWRQLPAFKRGRDVKALVLISTPRTYKGLSVVNASKHPTVRQQLSMLYIDGTKAKTARDSARVYSMFKRYHPQVPPEERKEKQALFQISPETNLYGMRLVNEPAFSVARRIEKFAELRLVNRAARYPWAVRQKP